MWVSQKSVDLIQNLISWSSKQKGFPFFSGQWLRVSRTTWEPWIGSHLSLRDLYFSSSGSCILAQSFRYFFTLPKTPHPPTCHWSVPSVWMFHCCKNSPWKAGWKGGHSTAKTIKKTFLEDRWQQHESREAAPSEHCKGMGNLRNDSREA